MTGLLTLKVLWPFITVLSNLPVTLADHGSCLEPSRVVLVLIKETGAKKLKFIIINIPFTKVYGVTSSIGGVGGVMISRTTAERQRTK